MTGSPIDKYSLAVFSHGNYKSHFRIQIGNKNGTLKNYYKIILGKLEILLNLKNH